MHAAASIARSASRFGTRSELASGALPVRAVMNPPAWMIRSNAPRSTTRSLITGNARARHGSIHNSAPSGNERMCSWHVVVAREQLLVEHVEHLEQRHIGTHVRHVVADKHPREPRPRLPPDVQRHTHYL